VRSSLTGRTSPACSTRRRIASVSCPVTVRVIEHTIEDGRDSRGPYPLLTTILDPEVALGQELAAADSERWETAFDQLKAHQRAPRSSLRAKCPALVLQGIPGHLCCHYAIRTRCVCSRWESTTL